MGANKDKQLKAFVIFVTGAGKLIEPQLTAMEAATGAHDIALAYLAPNNYAVRNYKINLDPSVKNTVLFYRDKTIVFKEVNLVADDKGLATLKSGVAKITK